jgi:hypothetical protein
MDQKTKGRTIRGAKRLAEYIFGNEEEYRAVYGLADQLGLYILGGMLAGQTDTIDAAIAKHEASGLTRRAKKTGEAA